MSFTPHKISSIINIDHERSCVYSVCSLRMLFRINQTIQVGECQYPSLHLASIYVPFMSLFQIQTHICFRFHCNVHANNSRNDHMEMNEEQTPPRTFILKVSLRNAKTSTCYAKMSLWLLYLRFLLRHAESHFVIEALPCLSTIKAEERERDKRGW